MDVTGRILKFTINTVPRAFTENLITVSQEKTRLLKLFLWSLWEQKPPSRVSL